MTGAQGIEVQLRGRSRRQQLERRGNEEGARERRVQRSIDRTDALRIICVIGDICG